MVEPPPAALLDANVLFPATLRDLLLRLAEAGFVNVFWSRDILEETFRSIARSRPGLTASRTARSRAAMERFFEGASIEGYAHRIDTIALPDPDDRHVLAAAIEGGVDYIVTRDVDDFPEDVLLEYGLERRTPDELVCELIDAHGPPAVAAVIHAQAAAMRRPPMSARDLLERLATPSFGLTLAAARLRELCQ